MKSLKIAVASGKGGTGKTTIAVNLALVFGECRLIDCDVEEPNAHIFLKPQIKGNEKVTLPVPFVNDTLCDFCGDCSRVCNFNAIAVVKSKVLIFEELCHHCGACILACPKGALNEKQIEIGIIEWGKADEIEFFHGKLNPGIASPTPLVKKIKNYANKNGIVIIDVAPGVSCPVVEALKGMDFCLLVTEPTKFGLHDLDLAQKLLKKLNVPHAVIINRSNKGDIKLLHNYCYAENLNILDEIPYDKELAYSYSLGEPIVKRSSVWRKRFIALKEKILKYAC